MSRSSRCCCAVRLEGSGAVRRFTMSRTTGALPRTPPLQGWLGRLCGKVRVAGRLIRGGGGRLVLQQTTWLAGPSFSSALEVATPLRGLFAGPFFGQTLSDRPGPRMADSEPSRLHRFSSRSPRRASMALLARTSTRLGVTGIVRREELELYCKLATQGSRLGYQHRIGLTMPGHRPDRETKPRRSLQTCCV